MTECCCGGCAVKPIGQVTCFDNILQAIQPLRQFCCACVPLRVCLDITIDAETQTVSLTLGCVPHDVPVYGDSSAYLGTVVIDDVSYDLRFQFEVTGEQCFLVLVSDDLGIDGTDPSHRLEITDENRSVLCESTTCKKCLDTFAGGSLDWSIDSMDLSLRAAPMTSLTYDGRGPCPECPPLDPSRRRCGRLCDSCSCICTKACITIVEENGTTTTEQVEIDDTDHTYTTGAGYVITVVNNPVTRKCELQLTPPEEDAPASPIANVAIGDGTTHPCPTPSVSWSFILESDPLKHRTVLFVCSTCGPCDQVAATTCCPDGDGKIPRVLSASVHITTPACCADFGVTLVYDDTSGDWEGTTYGVWASDGPCEKYVRLTLSCGNPDWTLTVHTDSVCLPTAVSYTQESGGTCDPLSLLFLVGLSGPSCCGENQDPMGPPLAASWEITITE